MLSNDFQVILEDDPQRPRSSIMMRGRRRRGRLPGMSVKWREQATKWAEWLVVLLLGGTALYEIWISPGAAWTGSTVVSTLLAAAIILPVLFRRRFPLAVLLTILAVSAVQYVYGGNAFSPSSPSCWPSMRSRRTASCAGRYSVGSSGDRGHRGGLHQATGKREHRRGSAGMVLHRGRVGLRPVDAQSKVSDQAT